MAEVENKCYIYRVSISQIGFNSVYHDYFIASDVTAIYYHYKDDTIRRIESIENLGALIWSDPDLFDKNDYTFSLFQFEYWGKLNSECNIYVVAKRIQDVHEMVYINPDKVNAIHKIGTIRYIKTFKEVDDEIENMRIG